MKKIEELVKVREIQLIYHPNKNIVNREKILSSSTAYAHIIKAFNPSTIGMQEEFNVLLLNKANKPIGVYKASRGGIDSTIIDIRLLMATALKSLATGLIISHNHPSGNIDPSEADKKITKKIEEACKFLDISLIDHLIVTPFGEYMSFADKGLLN